MQNIKKSKIFLFLINPAILEILFAVGILSYHILNTFAHKGIPNEVDIGYVDWAHYIRPYDDVLQGKVLQKDFYWFYGPLYLYLQVPLYSLFGANHYAVHVLTFQFLPAVGIVLSYFYIRLLINSSFLRILFLLICIFHFVNNTLAAPRHLGAELGLAFFLYSLTRSQNKWTPVLAGIFVGIGLLSGNEYGIPAFLVILAGCALCRMSGNLEIPGNYFARISLGIGIALAPFVFYMIYHRALIDYIGFIFDLINGFGVNNPGRGALISLLPELSFQGVTVFFESLYNAVLSQAFRFYLAIFIYFAALLLFVYKFYWKKQGTSIRLFVLAVYGLLIYFRTLAGPAYGYFVYGLIPAITLGIFLLEHVLDRGLVSFRAKQYPAFACHALIIAISLTWVYLTIENKVFFKLKPDGSTAQTEKPDRVYYEKVGFKISRKAYEQYEKVNKFIERNTKPNDYVLVYPFGYYNHFTGRPSPLTARDGIYDFNISGHKNYNKAIREMEDRKPEYVVLNTYNGGVQIGAIRGDTSAQVSWRTEDSPNFSSTGNPLEIYILENYHLVEKFDYAAILERNSERKTFSMKFRKSDVFSENLANINLQGAEQGAIKTQYILTSRNPRIEFILKEPVPATHVEIVFRVDTSFYKRFFTKGFLKLGIVDSRGSAQSLTSINDLSDLGKIKYAFAGLGPPTKEGVRNVKTIWVQFNTPKPYWIPSVLDILDLKLVFDERVG